MDYLASSKKNDLNDQIIKKSKT